MFHYDCFDLLLLILYHRFSSGIFHELHEEVMATVSRANVLALRVQQVEAEIPSVEKSLLCQNSETHYFHNTG